MSNIFSAPKAPRPDPSLLKAQKQEEKRAEMDRLKAIQDQLSIETRLRGQQFGLRSLLGVLGRSPLRSLLGSG